MCLDGFVLIDGITDGVSLVCSSDCISVTVNRIESVLSFYETPTWVMYYLERERIRSE